MPKKQQDKKLLSVPEMIIANLSHAYQKPFLLELKVVPTDNGIDVALVRSIMLTEDVKK